MTSTTPKTDLLSRLVNWFSNSGQDRAAIQRESRDLFSRLMNRISG